jgi:hypothetical protein
MVNYVNGNFNQQLAKSIVKDADNQLNELIKNCDEQSKNRKKYLVKSIFPAVSLYRAFQIQMSKEESFEHMDKMIEDNTKNNVRKIYEKLGKLTFFFSLFRKMLSTGLKGDSWEVEWIANNKTNFEYNIKKCLWKDSFIKYGCPELCALFCRNDEINFTNVSPRMRFERKGALGYGDDECDFHFYAVKK